MDFLNPVGVSTGREGIGSDPVSPAESTGQLGVPRQEDLSSYLTHHNK